MRLIDADKLIEVLNKKRVPFNANVNDAILTAPTVDAVKIVRCKDCKRSVRCCNNNEWRRQMSNTIWFCLGVMTGVTVMNIFVHIWMYKWSKEEDR